MIPLKLASSAKSGFQNREAWLTAAAVLLRPWFAARGYDIPLRLRLGVGALGISRRTLGVLYSQRDRDGFQHITVSPFIDDPVTVVIVLVHELIHAVSPQAELHGPRFRHAAAQLGLRPPFVMLDATPELRCEAESIVRRLGRYPHRAPLPEGGFYSLGEDARGRDAQAR